MSKKERLITRTVCVTQVKVLAIDTNTESVIKDTKLIKALPKTVKRQYERIQSLYPDHIKVSSITVGDTYSVKYGMSVDQFLSIANEIN